MLKQNHFIVHCQTIILPRTGIWLPEVMLSIQECIWLTNIYIISTTTKKMKLVHILTEFYVTHNMASKLVWLYNLFKGFVFVVVMGEAVREGYLVAHWKQINIFINTYFVCMALSMYVTTIQKWHNINITLMKKAWPSQLRVSLK